MKLKMQVNRVAIAAVVLLFGSAFWGCGIEKDYATPQRKLIESYLTRNSLKATITADSVYVVKAGNTLTPPPTEVAESGDVVVFYFAAYTFASAPATTPYYTNKRWLAATLPNKPNLEYWNLDPIRTKLGDSEILNSIESALLSCRKGDSLAAFFTSDITYGGLAMGVVPANTALMMVLTIDDVIKQ